MRWRAGGDALVYLLFEHQSSSDERMAFRLLRYLVRIWERCLTDRPDDALPVIVPIVLYHGDDGWSAPLAFEALFAIPEEAREQLAPHLVSFAYLLDDLSGVSDGELRARAATALGTLVQLVFKHVRSVGDFESRMLQWVDIVADVLAAPNGLEALQLVMRYILQANKRVRHESLAKLLEREVGPKAKEAVMTAGEELIQQGFVRGEQRLLLNMLRKRFGNQVDGATEAVLAGASVEQLEAWGERLLSSSTLADVFAG